MRNLSLILAATLVIACSPSTVDNPGTEKGTTEPGLPAAPGTIYSEAVASSSRFAEDRARDSGRKPAEVLEFIGIEPGMTVLDMFAGGGYYTEIIANIVGETGQVIAQTNEAYIAYVGDEFARRFGNNRLSNVEILMAENNELEL
ncbi:MAG: SAM-dependent methyltransferase, partial [Gammaproteobacteria bacterium]|nr:SAM-dependent methyltransferase [Gammaproteobacteria bacterium]